MSRNIKKIVEMRKKTINPHYDMTAAEMEYLFKQAVSEEEATSTAIMDAIMDAFCFGYEMGCRATKKEFQENFPALLKKGEKE